MKCLYFLVLVVISLPSIAQKEALYESIEYKNAYEKGTRQRTGLPGENYWQNRSDYIIKATFNPDTKIINGNLTITYYNESPDSLDILVFKLMHNIYKKGNHRQLPTNEINIHQGVKVENLFINNKEVSENSIHILGTVMRISLMESIKEKSKATIILDFETPLPKASGYRCGTIDSTSFFAAYWFPQVAVYDDIFGWDVGAYVGVAENYNDFSNYTVELTLPSEFNVWSTGEHVNKEQIFSPEIRTRINVSKRSQKPITIIGEEDFRKSDGNSNTWKFTAEHVPDFAWGASDHYLWKGVSANNPIPKNKCWVQTAYPAGAQNFDTVLEVAKKSVEILSKNFPGIAYPYFKHITFRGTKGGGMEFPMIANNNAHEDTTYSMMVTAHEIAHNYFPFMMGINERKYGWWDETMTTLMDSYVNLKGYPNHKIEGFFNRKLSLNYYAPKHYMLPLIMETNNIMNEFSVICNNHLKGPAAMDILVNIIGVNNFYKYTREFMLVWSNRHPTPYDFFYFINNKERENLNWFWTAWFFSFGYPDLAIVDASQNESYLLVLLENIGGLPVQFKLNIVYGDGTKFDEEFDVNYWKNDLGKVYVRIPVSGIVEKVAIDNRYAYDAHEHNNSFNMKK